MSHDFVGAVLAFAIGVAIATVGYRLSRYVLKTKAERYTVLQMGKQAVQVLYLVLIFCAGQYTPWSVTWLLVGGCLGITLPMLYFTYRLVAWNDAQHKKGGDE